MGMVGRPSVVRRQKYMTNICDITEPISLRDIAARRPFLLLPAYAASDRRPPAGSLRRDSRAPHVNLCCFALPCQ
eukprot:scaffold69036_cov32-Phaeocystis_antarctica.AAC.1